MDGWMDVDTIISKNSISSQRVEMISPSQRRGLRELLDGGALSPEHLGFWIPLPAWHIVSVQQVFE